MAQLDSFEARLKGERDAAIADGQAKEVRRVVRCCCPCLYASKAGKWGSWSVDFCWVPVVV